MRSIVLGGIAAFALAACSQVRGTFPLVSSRFPPRQHIAASYRTVQGQVCVSIFESAPDAVERAVEDALSKATEANALIDARAWIKQPNCLFVEGTAVRLE